MSPLEIAANAFNLISVWLAARNRISTWSVGIVGCVLYGLLFFEAKLYADVTLQFFFVVTSVYGWWNWKRGGESATPLPIRRLSLRHLAIYAAAAVAGTFAYGSLLHGFTDASFPFLDSVILSFSILAQLLLMSRVLENWLCWILVNIVAMPVYWSKGLHLTAVVYGLFLINAILGWRAWSREFSTQADIRVAA